MNKLAYEILVVGAGPAGLAAARSAASAGARVGIIEDNPYSGGQIWRGGAEKHRDGRARELATAISSATNITYHTQTRIVHAVADRELLAQTQHDAISFHYEKLILATGARELLLPFPGWTLPGVTGAGGLQALSKGGFPVAGKRVVVAGSGPLLLASAASLLEQGAIVSHVLEQASPRSLSRFALSLLATPGKLRQAAQLGLGLKLRATRYTGNSFIRAAHGDTQLQQVTASIHGKEHRIACDYLACGYGLLPNTELASAVGCRITDGKMQVDEWQRSSLENVYCAGEGTGIGGVDLSLAEGAVAGYAAIGEQERAREFFGRRGKWQAFARQLEESFALRQEVLQLSDAETLVCRCEDVSYRQLLEHAGWRDAKLHTRCGMGACQGRICGAATQALFGWHKDEARLPIFPTRVGSLLEE
ncbi:NAD(P)/FAD-dependent oxidoreductase [Undibacterium terreum]|uniref:Oxidoreductase n=1 Tax=Undibacterium terreum TaxID=1224302 RepID=A0A916XKC3_9BURK|nr:FAD/NAD(P)-binding oxidoreductase [Undibacterium terreum]GGC77699.1 oxidoreductase [Undibacterium terreum]